MTENDYRKISNKISVSDETGININQKTYHYVHNA